MSKRNHEMLFLHWAVKLVLTMLVGGLFLVVAFFVPASAMPNATLRANFRPLCVGIVVLAAMAFATFLHWREGKDWRRSLSMGVVMGLAGAAISVIIGYLFIMWLVSNIQLV